MSTALATAGIVRFHRSLGLSKRRHRIPRQIYPKSVELEYGKAIIAVVARARPAFAPLFTELPALLARAQAARADDDVFESDAGRARRLVAEATERMRAAIQPRELEALAKQFGTRTEVFQTGQLQRQIHAALGVDVLASDAKLPALLDHFVHENVALIRAVPEKMALELDKQVTRAFTSGTRHEVLAREIEDRFDIGERHARLIARDQVGKLAGQVNASRQRSIGITSFRWATVGDERVREEHEELDGQEFEYDSPPDEGLPGEAVLCRCSAEPIFDGILDAAEDDD